MHGIETLIDGLPPECPDHGVAQSLAVFDQNRVLVSWRTPVIGVIPRIEDNRRSFGSGDLWIPQDSPTGNAAAPIATAYRNPN